MPQPSGRSHHKVSFPQLLQLKTQYPKLGKQCSLKKTSLDKVYPMLRESNGRLVPLQEEVEAALKVRLQS